MPAAMETYNWSSKFSHLAERALTEDFEQFKLRWISFLTALFHVVGDRNFLICPIILPKKFVYERQKRLQVYRAHRCTQKPQRRKSTYTVWERLSLFHGLIHDLMSIDLQPNQQILYELTTASNFTNRIHPYFSLSRTMTAAAARPHVWWKIQKN